MTKSTGSRLIWLMVIGAVACTGAPTARPALTPTAFSAAPTPETPTSTAPVITSAADCPLTEPVWAQPPDDTAVQDKPGFGYYFVNDDRSIWASAWWAASEDYVLRVSDEGLKVAWFRPTGAALEITGRRLDGEAPSLMSEVPCCYPTRFQATGLYFPTEGCWEVSARAADSEILMVVWVEPGEPS